MSLADAVMIAIAVIRCWRAWQDRDAMRRAVWRFTLNTAAGLARSWHQRRQVA